MTDPEPELNDVDEAPSEFEEHGGDLAAAMADALERGELQEAERLREELREHNREHSALLGEKHGESDEHEG